MGQISLVQEAIRSFKENGSFNLVRCVLNDEPIFAGVAASPFRAHGRFCSGNRNRNFPRIAYHLVNPTILEESVPLWFVLSRRDSGRGVESCTSHKRAIWGTQSGAFTKLIELAQRFIRKTARQHPKNPG